MAEFVSSFITGFQDVVRKDLEKRFPDIKILNLFDGLVHYQFSGNSLDLEKIIYFNNTFFVLKTMKGKGINFPSLVGSFCKEKKYFLINKGTFRIRFQNENQFTKVDKNISRRAENYVLQNSKLSVDRLSPSTEIWFSIRREGFAFCGQLISKREFTEKNLNKGELRPEIAFFICSFADVKETDTVLEPFCGYGSIPVQLSKKFHFNKLFVSDLDKEKVEFVKAKKQISSSNNIIVCESDAMKLNYIEDKSIDVVITDPPWGFYEQIENIYDFYNQMFCSFKRIIKDEGKMIILSARKEEIEKAATDNKIKINNSLHTLVNGKKASLYNFQFMN